MRYWVYKNVTAGLVVAVVGFAQVAQAGILAGTSNAIPGFNGTRSYSDGPVFPPSLNDEINVDVDFAAFAPASSGQDTFDDFLSEFGIGFTHSVPNNYYVYAYQVHILSPTAPAAHILFTVGTQLSGELGGSARKVKEFSRSLIASAATRSSELLAIAKRWAASQLQPFSRTSRYSTHFGTPRADIPKPAGQQVAETAPKPNDC